MRKIIYLFITCITIVCVSNLAYAAINGQAGVYKVTVQKIFLLDDDGVTWVEIASPNETIDIGADNVGAGEAAASLVGNIPPGDYINFKIRISESITVKGFLLANYTKEGGAGVIVGTAATSADIGTMTVNSFTASDTVTTAGVDEGEITIQINLDGGDADDYIEIYRTADLGTAITVTEDSSISMWFDFDTTATIYYAAQGSIPPNANVPDDNTMYFLPPAAGTAMAITVDGNTTEVTAAETTMAF